MSKKNITNAGGAVDLKQALEPGRHGLYSRFRLVIAAMTLLMVGAAVLYLRNGESSTKPVYKTEPAEVGRLVVKVSATGHLQPTNKVDVGSELSGIVEQVFVDDNDRVRKGQLLARLDLSRLKDAVSKSRANLAAAEAQVLQAKATTAEASAQLERFRQVSRLSGGKVPSKSEVDSAEANLKRAQANEANAAANVTQARANLQSDETNLEKASICSPIDGMVLTRNIEPGQTVAASFQAPVLFTLAEDLTNMELQVDVDEADVGQVKVGQKATFTVDAWPGRQYSAVITRVGYGSQTKENVVSYPAVLKVRNDDLSLRPGMTGTADIVTVTRENALMVPNAALRFSPPRMQVPRKKTGSIVGALMPHPPAQTPKVQTDTGGSPRVWVLNGGSPMPVDIKAGATDGKMTEVLGGAIKAGVQIITEREGGS